MKNLPNSKLYEVLLNYDYFLIDVWGIVYNGGKILEGFFDFHKFLLDNNKNYTFLSNAPRPGQYVRLNLGNLGINDLTDEEVCTSGDFFLSEEHLIENNAKCFHIGADNHPLKMHSKLSYVNNIQEATHLVVTHSANKSEMDNYESILKICLKNNVKFLCPNPDIQAPGDNETYYTPGYLAQNYQNMGGEVSYYGKPYKEIYEFVFQKKNINNKEKTIMIGDSLVTDIKGANLFGIDSLLVLTGNHKNDKQLEYKINELQISPSYIANSLSK